MKCCNCGIELSRTITLVATVTGYTEDGMRLLVTEVDDRPLKIKGRKPVCFPYITQQGMEDLELCSIKCLKEKIHEASKRVV